MAGAPPRPTAFRAERYDLKSAGLVLSGVTAEEASLLAAALSAIEPWSRYPISAEALSTLFKPSTDGGVRLAVRRSSDTTPIGVMVIRSPWLVGPYMQFLAVLPAAQGCGIGAALLGWFEAEAQAAGIRNLWICVSAFNDRAQALYQRCGFERVARLDNLVQPGIDEILMRKTLNPSGS